MINITFPDGNIRQYEEGSSAIDIARSISEGLARNVLSAKINGEVYNVFTFSYSGVFLALAILSNFSRWTKTVYFFHFYYLIVS